MLFSTAVSPVAHSAGERPLAGIIDDSLSFAAAQYERMLAQMDGQSGLPRSWAEGELMRVPVSDWTSGFFPGCLWFLFEATGDPKWRNAAREYTAKVEDAKRERGTHDVGFKLSSSFGHGWRLTGDEHYRAVLLEGAASMSTRFNPAVGCIRSWDGQSQWAFPVIIDNLMNLELLTWAARNGGDPCLRNIAISHASTTLRHHFRDDASSYHVVDYHPETGEVVSRQTHQGLSDDSAWARGQAWGLYGYTMLHRELQLPACLRQAIGIAEYILGHPRLPEDKAPYWDFDAPAEPATPRDVSAAAIICSALLELSTLVPAEHAETYREFAHAQIRALSSDRYRAPPGGNGCFLLMHATGNHPQGSEIDVPLVYADYYFLEALLRARRSL